MLSAHQSPHPNPIPSLKQGSSLSDNPEKASLGSTLTSESPQNIIKVTSNFTKSQIMQQRDSVFITDSRTAPNLVKFLDDKNLNYIGSDFRYFQVTKEESLTAAACSGMMLPHSAEVSQLSDLEDCALDVPMMVKPSREISETRGRQFNSLVTKDKEQLRTTVAETIQKFGGATLQHYVAGRQIGCLCYSSGTEIRTLSPVEFPFKEDGPKYVTFELLNDPSRKQWYEPCQDEQLSNRVRKSVESFFKVLRLSGEFVFSLRVNGSAIYLIGFEPISFPLQEGVRPFEKGSLVESILFHSGVTRKAFLQTMVESAALRQAKRRRNFSVRFNKEKNVPALYAEATFEADSEIYEQQNARENIVIVDWVKEHFDEVSWGDFWSRDSRGWKPVRHSCSPNARVLLNSVKAIKRINRGEEITVDFATLFYHKRTFECDCKSSNCRGTIQLNGQNEQWFRKIPSSYFHPWMIDYMLKGTLVTMLNNTNSIVKLNYSPGDCYAVTKRDVSKGQIVIPLDELPIDKFNTRHNITKGQGQYWDTKTSFAQFLNHSCQDYTLVINQENTSMIARDNIPKDQILTFNYFTTEWDVCYPFTCLCMAPKCFGLICGFTNLPQEKQEEIINKGICSQFINSKFKAEK